MRDTNPDDSPFILAIIVDGHDSRMGLPFLKYINEVDEGSKRWDGILLPPSLPLA